MTKLKPIDNDDLDPAELLPSENEPLDKTAPAIPNSNKMPRKFKNSKDKLVTIPPFHISKSKKVLTNTKDKRIMKRVHKIIRKDDNRMESKTPKTKKQSKSFDWQGAIKSLAWLVEAAFRGFVGWILLSNFDNTLTVAVAIYALGTAGVIVVMHFVRAHRK